MKKLYYWLFLLTATGLMVSYNADAQQIRTAYFLKDSPVAYSMNPANYPLNGYVSVPGLGFTGAGFGTNGLQITDFVFHRDGEYLTFIDESVSLESFLGKVKMDNRVNTEFRTEVLSAGWYKGPAFWSAGVSVKGSVNVSVPKSLLSFAKWDEMTEQSEYDIRNLLIYAETFMETYVGYSRKVIPGLTVGGRGKFLIGLGNMHFQYDRINAVRNGDMWLVTTSGYLNASVRNLEAKLEYDMLNKELIDGFKFGNSVTPAGYGGAIDVGATYEIIPRLKVSASVLDLGFITWSKKSALNGVGDDIFDFGGFKDKGDNAGSQFDNIGDGLMEIFRLEPTETDSRTTALRSTLNAGVEYVLPNNMVGFGLLSATRFNKGSAYSELTASVNYQPVWWFSTTASYSFVHSRFRTFGMAFNFSPSWIYFFMGTDYVILNTSRYIPKNISSANFYFGLSVPISRNYCGKKGKR